MKIDELNDEIYQKYQDFLMHYGVGWDDNPPGPGSGRYPHGSGENPGQHGSKNLKEFKSELTKKGFTELEIAKALGFNSTSELRKAITFEKERRMTSNYIKVKELKDSGMSNVAIAEKLGMTDTNVAKILNEHEARENRKTTVVADRLKEELKTKHYIDTSAGSEIECGVSKTKMDAAIEALKAEGYKTYYIKQPQMGNPGKYTTIRVLGDPDSDWKAVFDDHTLIQPIQSYFENNGETALGILPVKSISSDRVRIRYTGETPLSGDQQDGLIEIRAGVEDVSLGRSKYAQVRIGVDGTHYMKGMAVYGKDEDFPPGIDIIYNTNKKVGTDKYEVYKEMKVNKLTGEIDMDNPFGATIKRGGQRLYIDENGVEQQSVINKINDQGDWGEWQKKISPQLLSKQPKETVKKQLELTYKDRLAEYEELMALDNPTVKRKLLESFADDCDASASHMKAKAFPGQAAHVIIPVPSLRDDEVYAPNYEQGEWVALVRFPYASPHESPKLRVNNKNPDAIRAIGKNAQDAICINANVAAQMSGADFDGDTAVVIPLKSAKVNTGKTLPGLIGFDTKMYKFDDPDAPGINSQTKQKEMGIVTNLIADMQLKGCNDEELTRAIKHSMVVIDSEKHHLDYKKSEADNNIESLKKKYQQKDEEGKYGGASTLITRAKSEIYINERKLGSIVDEETGKTYYAIDPRTGKKIWVDTGKTYFVKSPTKKDPDRLKEVKRQEKVTKMDMVDDARELLSSQESPHPVEVYYAQYANNLKALANEARKQMVATPKLKRDPEAAKEYATEVEELKAQYRLAKSNAPKERQAQILAESIVKAKIASNPEIKDDKAYKKKISGQALTSARDKVGAKKEYVEFTDKQWEAIQKGAISDNLLMELLNNTKDDAIKKRATPKATKIVSDSMASLAKSMANSGYSNKEIAERLGVSTSTVSNILHPKE